ncbi:Mitochondrial ATPase complex subunit atp10 [Sporothrix bragantina]|uniref:Mitochondrial ATPase complex subunit atp10 n=1 Tax=Sporothrix bragantina TaxID=671064 RepID=A0ABP0AVA3_9PEZI
MASQRISLAVRSRRKAPTASSLLWTSPLSFSSTSTPAVTASCMLCQWRTFSASARVLKDVKPAAPAKPQAGASSPPKPAAEGTEAPAAPPAMPSPLADAPRSYGKRLDEFTPTPLSRPIGMQTPPVAGDNSGIDARTLQQKRDDFVNYEKHLIRRKELKSKMVKPYFRDWTNLQFYEGKTFISPPRLFRNDVSLYFPNLVGQRLLSADKAAAKSAQNDTTPMFEQNAATIVAFFSSLWAENQVRSFVSADANPELAEVLTANSGPGKAQLMHINYEDNAMKAWLVRRFTSSLKKRIDKRDWEQYMLVTQGVTDDIRENIGLLNAKVGYVYLVDKDCRIRWAGSGPSQPEERHSLVKGVQRLLAEAKTERS